MSKTQSEIAADLATEVMLLRKEIELGTPMEGGYSAVDSRSVRLAHVLERLCEVTAMLAARIGA